jgi:hypothetical protein
MSSVEVTMEDTVSILPSPYNPSQVQTQQWVGADFWSMTITLPRMSQQTAAPWRGFMAAAQGVLNVFQIGDPFGVLPQGVAHGAPTCTGTNNAQGTNSLVTGGWAASVNNQLMAGDYIQIVNRLYQVTQNVNSDSSGNATIALWPSLREVPPNGTALILNNTKGIFRLGANTRTWHADSSRLVQMSFKLTEVR